MPSTPTPPADEAFAIPPGAARAHGCCCGWRAPGGRPTAEVIELATAQAPVSNTEDKTHDDPAR
ncbi:hypothetical protein [Azonexus sp.]|uniref:hypothetical protein n=1 Tax=Azonexus sp. TaxID=1872668 RepID=UPI0035AE484F